MTKNYKIYFNEGFVLFTAHPNESGVEQKYWYKIENHKEISQLISTFQQQSDIPSIAIVDKDAKAAFKVWKEDIKYIKAAGGLIQNEEGKYLFILRLGKWDLPKGKMENGEIPEHTAIREVEEETCVQHVTIKKELPSTYHTYLLKDQLVLKRTYWYLMHTENISQCQPQTEEHIEEIKWFSPDEFDIVLKNTYPSIRDVLREIRK